MPTKERRRKKIVYKHAHIKNWAADVTLEEAIRRALHRLRTIGQRKEPLAPVNESPIWRLIGQSQDETGALHALLARYTPGLASLYLEDDESATSLAMKAVPVATAPSGKRRELVEGMLFLTVSGNHLVLMQTQALRSGHLEEHLTWLLRKARQIPEDASVILADQPPASAVRKARKSPVKAINLGGSLLPDPSSSDGYTEQEARPTKRDFDLDADNESSNRILETLKGLISKDRAASLELDALQSANFKYTLSVTYERTTTRQGQKLLNSLALALRHSDSVEATVKLKDGSVLTGDQLRLGGHINVDVWDGIPNPNEVFALMKLWLQEQLSAGELNEG